MSAPERLNVLLSRARNGLVMIGNAETFSTARKGSELWSKFLGILKLRNHIYEGLPIKCERHPDRTALLREAPEFDSQTPDGGCLEDWYVKCNSSFVLATYVPYVAVQCSAVDSTLAHPNVTSSLTTLRCHAKPSFSRSVPKITFRGGNALKDFYLLVKSAIKRRLKHRESSNRPSKPSESRMPREQLMNGS